MESASVSVVGFTPESPEWLSLDTDFTLPGPLSASVSYVRTYACIYAFFLNLFESEFVQAYSIVCI